jgi:DNA-binding transcriptional MerR regulator
MAFLSIGEVAKRTGVAASTLRYYEKAGLLPPPARTSKRRRYDAQSVGRIRIIRVARDAGFTISETRTFLEGFALQASPAARWDLLARRKLAELDALIAAIGERKALLETSFRCECRTLAECERLIGARS